MKTPTQLAEAVIAKDTWREWDYDAIRNAIAEGIEADRAQRFENAIKAARYLKSEDGENPEYDRALVELICDTHPIPGMYEFDDKRAYIEACLRGE